MNQIFTDHLPYMIAGVVSGIVLICIPGQAKRSKRISRIIGLITGLYPLGIIGLYLGRSHLGESYAYLIFGGVIAGLLGLVAGGLFIAWIVLYAMDFPWEKTDRRS
jgi:hypothetical protein